MDDGSPLAYAPRPGPLARSAPLAASPTSARSPSIALRLLEPDRARRRAAPRSSSPGCAPGAGRAPAQPPALAGCARRRGRSRSTRSSSQRGDTILVRGFDLPGARPDRRQRRGARRGRRARAADRRRRCSPSRSTRRASTPTGCCALVRPIARRSALTATLIARLVPLAAADHARLREARELRGPAPRRSAAPRSPGGWSPARSTARSTSPRRSSCAATRCGPPRCAAAPAARASRAARSPPRRWRSLVVARRAARRRRRTSSAYPTIAIDAERGDLALSPRCRCSRAARALAVRSAAGSRRRRRAVPEPVARASTRFAYRYPEAAAPGARRDRPRARAGRVRRPRRPLRLGQDDPAAAACGLVPHFHGGEVAGELERRGPRRREHGPAELGGVGRPRRPGPRGAGRLDHGPRRARAAAGAARRARRRARARGRGGGAGARRSPTLLERTDGHALRRRAAAGRARRGAGRPARGCVLLDEPTSQLDPVAGDELIGLLRRLNEEWGMAVVLAEHRLERCLAAADRVVALDGGPDRLRRRARASSSRWALDDRPALATPGARLFVARRRPPAARSASRTRGRRSTRTARRAAGGRPGARAGRRPAAGRPRPRPALALQARDLWVELDDGDGAARGAARASTSRSSAGERVALMGRNGAGKSTLLRTAAGLLEPARGPDRGPGAAARCCPEPRRLPRPRARRRGAARRGGRGGAARGRARVGRRSRPARPLRRRAPAAGAGDRDGRPRRRRARPGSSASTSRRAAWTAPARTSSPRWLGELAARGLGGRWSRPTTSSSPPRSPSASSCSATAS